MLCLVTSVVSDSVWPHGLHPTRLLCPCDFPSKNIEVGCHFLLKGIFSVQRSNPRQYLHHFESLKIFWKCEAFNSLIGCLCLSVLLQRRTFPLNPSMCTLQCKIIIYHSPWSSELTIQIKLGGSNMLYSTEQTIFSPALLHPQHRIMFISLSDGCGISTGNGDAESKDVGLGIQSSYMNNSTKVCNSLPTILLGQKSFLGDLPPLTWFSHFPLSSSQGRGPTQHFGLLSPHRCCIVSLLAGFGSAWCLLCPLSVGCHNDIRQSREAWQSNGWARWRGGGRTELSHPGFQQGWWRGRWP